MLMRIKFCLVLAAFVFLSGHYLNADELRLAPDFTLQDLDKVPFTLSEYRDKQKVILFFWATWCPYCRKELRLLSDRYADLLKDGWEVVAIDVGESSARVSSFVKSYNLPFRVILDIDQSVASAYELIGIPTYFFINKKGDILLAENYFPEREYKGLLAQ